MIHEKRMTRRMAPTPIKQVGYNKLDKKPKRNKRRISSFTRNGLLIPIILFLSFLFLPSNGDEVTTNENADANELTTDGGDNSDNTNDACMSDDDVCENREEQQETIVSSENDNDTPTQKQQTTTKPQFILHVGPPKTSTTTLQWYLTEYYDTLLEEDNIMYVGRIYDKKGIYYGYTIDAYENLVDWECQMGGYPSGGGSDDTNDDEEQPESLHNIWWNYADNMTQDWPYHEESPACWKDFLVEIERLRRMHVRGERTIHVFISDEMLSIRGHNQEAFHYRTIYDTLSPNDWDVRILATYRRFYAWLPSERNHYGQYLMSDETPKILEWDDQMIMENLWEQIKGGVRARENIQYPYFDDIKRYYGEYFPDSVEIINMHDLEGYPTLASFIICKYLPNAQKTCELSLSEEEKAKSATKLNKGKSGFYDILAMTAYRQGYINKSTSLSRTQVRDMIQEVQENVLGLTPYDFPLSCPTREDVKDLLGLSLAYEEEYFPKFYYSKNVEQEHISDFWKYYEKKKFCSIDAKEALKNDIWLQFFESISDRV